MSDGAKGVIEKAVVGAVAVVAVAKGVKGASNHDGQKHDRHQAPVEAEPTVEPTEDTKPVKAWLRQLDTAQRRRNWLGFPLATVKKFGEDQAGNLAALISYYSFFSIFPLMLALVTILGFVLEGHPDLQRSIVDSALAQFPVIGDQIGDNVGSLGGNWMALTVGLAGALWAGMGAVDAAQNAMNSIWDVPVREQPKFLARRLRSLVMLLVLGGGLLLSAGASTVASTADSVVGVGRLVAPLLAVVVNIAVFATAFRVLPQAKLRWSAVMPGAAVAGLAAAVLQTMGGFIIDKNLQGASQTYGTFAVVIGLLSWIYLQAQVTLFAAEINVVRAGRLWPRSLVPGDLTEGDRRALAQHAEVEARVADQDVRTVVPGERRELARAG